ncbi:MAG: prolyl oligopeptidase family serine peptidase [Candidatus Uhrbacteria bacterium]|nr:prolyl oligopeptidase family serine peptidase [Candidatus Uhrbacteria bacterium]MDP3793517.1 prolyl oligopeptidase family serine peptidase [Candidatus Uhrbacteria bacterium]
MPKGLNLILKTEIITWNKNVERFFRLESKSIALKHAKQNSRSVSIKKIWYCSQGHLVVGFIIKPKKINGKLPCIIYNRGGSGEFGIIQESVLFSRLACMALWGYLVIATQYSGNGGSEGKDEFGGGDLEDVFQLYKILKKDPRADVTRIGMYGGSRGGMMAYLALAKVKWIKAAITVGGVTNLFRQDKLRPEMKKLFQKMFGGSKTEKQKRSAIFWTHRFCKKTPLLIMHGTADWRVSPLDSLELSQKLYQNKVPHRLVLFEGADHGLTEYKSETMELTRQWLDRFVKNRERLPNLKFHGL